MGFVIKYKIPVLLLVAITGLLFFQGCDREETEARSIEQIREDEGVPINIETIKHQPFQKTLSFFSKLSGIKESTKGAIVGGKIEKVNARVGDRVSKDQIIIKFAEDNPGLQFEQAKTAYENAEKTYLRMKALLTAGETSQANFDGVEAQYLVSKRNYESLKQMLFIEAPFNGTVVDIKVNEGDNVKNDVHLFTVAETSRMRTRIWATEQEIIQIRRGMEAFIEHNNNTYIGRVTEISLAADPYKQAFYAEIEFNNPRGELRSGVVVDVKIVVYENNNAILVPRNLVMNDENGKYVYLENNGAAEKRYIGNGMQSGALFEVKSGLNIGEKLVTHGAAQLVDGRKVKVIQ